MIKVEVKQAPVKAEYWPKLMITEKGTVVLFSAPRTGTIMQGIDDKKGAYYTDWVMEEFKPFRGSITLTQE